MCFCVCVCLQGMYLICVLYAGQNTEWVVWKMNLSRDPGPGAVWTEWLGLRESVLDPHHADLEPAHKSWLLSSEEFYILTSVKSKLHELTRKLYSKPKALPWAALTMALDGGRD